MAERNASDNDIPIWILDTVTKPKPEHEGAVILAGSHGGIYAGYLAAWRIRAVLFSTMRVSAGTTPELAA